MEVGSWRRLGPVTSESFCFRCVVVMEACCKLQKVSSDDVEQRRLND